LDQTEYRYRAIAQRFKELCRSNGSRHMALVYLEMASHYERLADIRKKYSSDEHAPDEVPDA
jgi:hypothetical protein